MEFNAEEFLKILVNIECFVVYFFEIVDEKRPLDYFVLSDEFCVVGELHKLHLRIHTRLQHRTRNLELSPHLLRARRQTLRLRQLLALHRRLFKVCIAVRLSLRY